MALFFGTYLIVIFFNKGLGFRLEEESRFSALGVYVEAGKVSQIKNTVHEMSRKFLPILILGFLGMILAISLLIWAPFQGAEDDSKNGPVSFRESMRDKLNEIRISELECSNATLEEVVEFLRLRSIESAREKESVNRGVGFVVRQPRTVEVDTDDNSFGLEDGLDGEANPNSTRVSLSAEDIGLAEALDLVCEQAGLKWKVDEEILKIVISPIEQ